MPRIVAFDLLAVDLPLRTPFRHAAAVRTESESLFLRCTTDVGSVGWGECLPRDYVTGETRDGAFRMLAERILPRLVGRELASLAEVEEFLETCGGQAPPDWIGPTEPQTAAWCAVDLALLDAVGRACGERVWDEAVFPEDLRYSGVMSADSGWSQVKKALLMRLVGLPAVKLKIERDTPDSILANLRRVFGRAVELRADANMAWTVDEALEQMPAMARHGIRMFEQPLPPDQLEGLARLVRETGLGVMADESLSDRASLDRLIREQACTAVNVRISKCGGLVGARQRCREALAAGLTVQIGCQVGESSLLSAAHLTLCAAVQDVASAEGCFSTLVLALDPVRPMLRFRSGGRAPARPAVPGLGVTVSEQALAAHTSRRVTIPAASG